MVMLNYFRNIDPNVIHIDFLLQSDEISPLEQEVLDAGATIYRAPKPSKNFFGFISVLRKVLSSGEYKIVHAHCDAMNYRVMRIARQCGVPVRIAHSHNTRHLGSSRLRSIYYEFCRKRVAKYATHCWACSNMAGRWLFGNHPYTLIPNAIPLERFRFDPAKREELRKRYGIREDEFLIGHVGRFDYQKNPGFLIDLMVRLKASTARSYRLIMVGGGHLLESIREQAARAGVADRIIFTDTVADPQTYYHMMDLFVLPSLFEGYPVVMTEAEANGLHCLASDTITREVNVRNMVEFLPLVQDAWVEAVEKAPALREENCLRFLEERGFDIYSSARRMQEEYLRLYQEAVR